VSVFKRTIIDYWDVLFETDKGELPPNDVSEALRAIPGVQVYDFGWRVPDNAIGVVNDVLRRFGHAPIKVLEDTLELGPSRLFSILLPHQRQAVQECAFSRPSKRILADSPGLGKTRTAIVWALSQASAKDFGVLVIAPKFVIPAWIRELDVVYAVEKEPLDIHVLNTTSPPVGALPSNPSGWYFIHYDILHYWQGVLAGRFKRVILDEAHFVKNKKAQRSKAAYAVALTAPRRLLLTGTPLVNYPTDLWHLLTLACGVKSWGSLGEFLIRYCGAYQGEYGLVPGEPTNQDELWKRLQTCYLRRTPEDLEQPMPSLTRNLLFAEPSTAGSKAYSRAVGKLEVPIEDVVEALKMGKLGKHTLAALAALRQETTKIKLPTTAAYVADLLCADESVVVFTHERATTAALLDAIREHVQARSEGKTFLGLTVTGAQSAEQRADLVAQFQHQKSPSVLVATYDSLGVGVTLTRARHVVLHDLVWTPSALLQAEGRVHRVSQTRSCVSTWVVASLTIDEVLASVLERKARYLSEVLRDAAAKQALDEVQIESLLGEGSFEDEVMRWVERGVTSTGGESHV